MRRTKDEYIRQRIQYENLRRANCFFLCALLVMPITVIALECLLKGALWHWGNSAVWITVWELLCVLTVFAVHKKAAEPQGDHRHFLYLVWAAYLVLSDLLVFNLQDSVAAQILLWGATVVFIVSYLSSGRGSTAGLLLQTAAAMGLIWFYRLGLDIVVYNVLLLCVCRVLADYAFRLYEQRTADQWMLRIATQKSERDPMTGLLNRRGFEPKAEQMLQLARKKRQAIGIMMVDIDNFKKYNDTFGHPEGDKCIITVGEEIRRITKEAGGICARLGGEEFAVVLRGMSEVDFLQYAKKLKMAVEERKLPQAPDNFYPYVTISIGVDHRPRIYTDTYEELYHTADQALYRAKEGGRNCIYMRETRVSKMVSRYFA